MKKSIFILLFTSLAMSPVFSTSLSLNLGIGLRNGVIIQIEKELLPHVNFLAYTHLNSMSYESTGNYSLNGIIPIYNLKVAAMAGLNYRLGNPDRFSIGLNVLAGLNITFLKEGVSLPDYSISREYQTTEAGLLGLGLLDFRWNFTPHWGIQLLAEVPLPFYYEEIMLGIGVVFRW